MATKRISAKAKALKEILPRLDAKQRAVVQAYERRDSWMNAATGFGIIGRDSRMSSEFHIRTKALEEWEELYRGCDIAANICDAAPDAMTREGWEPNIEDDEGQELAKAIISKSEVLKLSEHIETALKLANAMGGSCILLGADDGQKADQPLRLDRIKTLNWMTVMSPRELWVHQYYSNPKLGQTKFGEPELYKVVNVEGDNKDLLGGTGGIIHESRLIRFEGVKVSHRVRRRQRGWGDSVLLRCDTVIRDYNMSWSGAAKLLNEFSILTLKVKGLAEMVAEDGDASIQGRAQALSLARSIAGLLLLDTDEELTRETASIEGFTELLQEFGVRLATAARMPVIIMQGQSPSGLNATGDADIRAWYDQVRSKQTRKLTHPLLYAYKCMFLAKDGPTKGVEPENYTVTFRPLWQMSDAEKALLRFQQMQTDTGYVNAGILPATLVAKQRFGGPTYSVETRLSDDDIKAMDEADKLEQETSTLVSQAKQKQMEGVIDPKPDEVSGGQPAIGNEMGDFGQQRGKNGPIVKSKGPGDGLGNGSTTAPHSDGHEDQPRDAGGKWTGGGGGPFATAAANVGQTAKPLKERSTKDLATTLHGMMQANPSVALKSSEYRAIAKELKKRKVTTFIHLHEAMNA